MKQVPNNLNEHTIPYCVVQFRLRENHVALHMVSRDQPVIM